MIFSRVQSKSNVNLLIATCTANLATVAAGCVLAWSSPTVPKITKDGEKIMISKPEAAWLSSLVAVGATLGPFIASSFVNKIGRKWTILADMLIFLMSWFMLAYYSNIYVLYSARILAGIGVGCVFTVIPIYIAEIAPLSLRSILGSTLQLFLCFGFLISYIIGPYTSYITLIIVSAIVPLLCISTFIWIPESPHYSLNNDQKEDALESLHWLRGYPEKSLTYNEISDMLSSVEEAKHNKGNICTLFTNQGYFRALYYACALAFFQQMSGINIVLFYAETIFRATGAALSPSISTIVIGLVLTVAASTLAPAATFFGVRRLLLFSALGNACSLAGLAFYFCTKDSGHDVAFLGWLPVTSLVGFITSYSLGFGPFVWVFMAEIFPAHLKAIASAIVASFCWFTCFILTRYFESFTVIVGAGMAFGLFGIFCLTAFFFVLMQLPDIQGKSYHEIQQMLTGKKKLDFSDIKV